VEDNLLNKTFRDSEGNIVIAQPPNLPLIVWVVATGIEVIVKSGNIHTIADVIAFGSLFTWAWEELFQGVNYFRRALGLIVLIGAIALRIQWA